MAEDLIEKFAELELEEDDFVLLYDVASQDSEFREGLEKRLEKFEIDLDILIGLQGPVYIAGSTIVQTILDKDWPSSDVDVYISETDLETMTKRLEKIGYSHSITSEKYVGMQVYKFWKLSKTRFDSRYSRHERAYQVFKACDKIDLVVVRGPSVSPLDNSSFDEFFDSFDMDICASRYDVQNDKFIFKHRELALKGITHYSPTTRYLTFDGKNTVQMPEAFLQRHCADRVAKYTKRGIKILGEDDK